MIVLLISTCFLIFTNKIEIAILGLIVLCNNYLGLGDFFKSTEMLFGQPIDPALILFVFIYVKVYFIGGISLVTEEMIKVRKYILFFVFFILSTIIVDYFYNDIDVISVLRTSRHWLLLFVFIPLLKIPSDNLMKVVDYLYYITFVITIIIVVEFISGIHIFTREVSENYAGSFIVHRGALPSTFAAFYALMITMGYKKYKIVWRIVIVGLFLFSLLLSATKSIALGVFMGFVLLVIFKYRNNGKLLFKMFGVLLISLAVIMALPDLRTRLIVGAETYGDANDGSSTFRKLLVEERIDYVLKSPKTIIFGIGNVTEDKFQGYFKTGLINKDGDKAKLDTSDIAWALSILRLGILGTLILIGMFWAYIKQLIQYLENPYAIVLLSYLLVNLFVLSFASVDIFYAYFWIMPLIMSQLIFSNYIDESYTY